MTNLNQYQIKALEESRDNRAINQELLNALADEKGALNIFLCFVKEHEDLNICFRGNQNNPAIEIYYLNHVVWKLNSERKGFYRITFNFGHAKGMPKETEYLRCLRENYGFKAKPKGNNIYIEKKQFTKDDINDELWHSFKEIMDFYFDPSKGKPNIEKRWQHKFFKDFHKEKNLFNGLYIYDLEYHQKLPHKKELLKIFGNKSDDELKEMRVHSQIFKKDLDNVFNEPDFLGIEAKEETGEICLVFGEVKSLYESCEGTSGIDSHLCKMKSYQEMKCLINKRKTEAEELLKQYSAIGDIKGQYCFDGLSQKLKIKNVLVLTNSKYYDVKKYSIKDWRTPGGAITFFNRNTSDIIPKAKSADCEIWLVENARCDDINPITLDDIKKINFDDYE